MAVGEDFVHRAPPPVCLVAKRDIGELASAEWAGIEVEDCGHIRVNLAAQQNNILEKVL